ncbi:DnaT-like ssDNA-binding domain-containing protein [Marinomonas piezotolerans]|uniref:DnaT-like ssDNA-binding domain-containing protein n=1 Tax=Marinomonas piezotolerans TaxID=2213058 RepID=UPI001FE42FA2|nr:DnaT-like ssDNA-binding domain-containing protein [Marinomonas piezotolerans]
MLTFLRQRAHHLRTRQMVISHRDLVDMLPFWTAPYIVRLLTSLQMAGHIQFRKTDVGLELLLEQERNDSEKIESVKPASRDHFKRQSNEKEDALGKLSRLQSEASKKDQPQATFTNRNRVSEPDNRGVAPMPMAGKGDRRGVSDFDLYLEAKERNRQPDQWLPEDATFEQIQQAGIERAFAESLLAEFLLRIKEQRKNVRTWNSEFFKYVKRQWQYKQSDRQSYEGTSTAYSANSKSNREQVSSALTNIHDTDW